MSRLARDGTAKPVSRDQILRREQGPGNINFPFQLTTSRIDMRPAFRGSLKTRSLHRAGSKYPRTGPINVLSSNINPIFDHEEIYALQVQHSFMSSMVQLFSPKALRFPILVKHSTFPRFELGTLLYNCSAVADREPVRWYTTGTTGGEPVVYYWIVGQVSSRRVLSTKVAVQSRSGIVQNGNFPIKQNSLGQGHKSRTFNWRKTPQERPFPPQNYLIIRRTPSRPPLRSRLDVIRSETEPFFGILDRVLLLR